jgi:hypothetical protein
MKESRRDIRLNSSVLINHKKSNPVTITKKMLFTKINIRKNRIRQYPEIPWIPRYIVELDCNKPDIPGQTLFAYVPPLPGR